MRKTGIRRKTSIAGRIATIGRRKTGGGGIKHKSSTNKSKSNPFEAKYKVVKKLSTSKNGTKTMKVKLRTDPTKKIYLAQHFTHNLVNKQKRNIKNEVELQRKAYNITNGECIAKIIDYYETDKGFYVVQEFLPGKSVFDKLQETKKKRLINSEVEVGVIIVQLLEILVKCHEENISHNNLIPTKLIYTEKPKSIDGKIKLTQFREKNNFNGDWLFFASPESIEGRKITNKQDIWMLGVICFQLLSGNVPFYDSNPGELVRKISRGQFKFKDVTWKSRGILCKEFIRNCLKVDLDKRFSAEEALNSPWIAKVKENSATWQEIEASRKLSKSSENLMNLTLNQEILDNQTEIKVPMLTERDKSS